MMATAPTSPTQYLKNLSLSYNSTPSILFLTTPSFLQKRSGRFEGQFTESELSLAMSKKLINAAGDVVDEALAGLVAASPGLTMLNGHRVVIRADVQQVIDQEKVSDLYVENLKGC